MKIKADLIHSPEQLRPAWCQVEKVVELTGLDFDAFLAAPQEEQPFLADNAELMHPWNGVNYCLLVLAEGRTDGVLVDSEGGSCARYAAYLPQARTLVNAELDRAVDHIVRQGTEHTANGYWCVYCEELEEKFGLTIPKGSGLDTMLKDALKRRPEVAAVDMANGAIETSFHPEFCKCLDAQKKAPASFSPERTAELFDSAVTAVVGLYQGEDLYTMLHGSFGLTIQEIREHGYLSDEELSDICNVPQQMLDGGMRVRDILNLDNLSERASLSHKNSVVLVPLEDLKKLTSNGQEEFSSLLDARVTDIQVDDGAPELVLEGVEAKELERFCDMLEAHEQAEQAMGPAM